MTQQPMSTADFLRHGQSTLELLGRYMESLSDRPIIPNIEPGDISSALPTDPPQHPESFDQILADIESIVVPGLVGWQAPGWFAYFPANSSPPAVLGELLSAGFAQQGMLWSTSPAATELEALVLDWLVDLLGLPQRWKTTSKGGGVIQMSASDASHTALVVARMRARRRATIDRQVVYASSQAHSSIEKGARVAGFEHIRLIGVDDRYAMSAQSLRETITEDIARGLTPSFVSSVVGSTQTTAVDPVRQVGEIARAHDMWHHVDAAYAGSAMILPELRHHQEGLELVDSYVFNPHKWMFTNFDCSVFYVRDRAPLIETMSIVPPYLRPTPGESAIDYRDWHLPLGRRFRALKLWMVIRSYGADGVRTAIGGHLALAQSLVGWIGGHPDLELVAPAPFALVCFRHRSGDDRTNRLIEAINASKHSYVTPSTIDGKRMIRVSIGQTNTSLDDVERLWGVIERNC